MTGVTIIARDEVGSTMDEAHALAAAGAPHGTTVWARRQAAGRGSRGRTWSSDEGGLWLSVVARPRRDDAVDTMALRIGLGIAETIERLAPGIGQVGLKWPNDLFVGTRKIGGILCEARWSGERCQWVVVGVGLNVHNAVGGVGHAANLAALSPDIGVVDDLVDPVARAISMCAKDAGPLDELEMRAFEERDVLRGRRTLAPVAGTIAGITTHGALQVRTTDSSVTQVLAGLIVEPE